MEEMQKENTRIRKEFMGLENRLNERIEELENFVKQGYVMRNYR